MWYQAEGAPAREHGCTIHGPTYCTFFVNETYLPGHLHEVTMHSVSRDSESEVSDPMSAHTSTCRPAMCSHLRDSFQAEENFKRSCMACFSLFALWCLCAARVSSERQ